MGRSLRAISASIALLLPAAILAGSPRLVLEPPPDDGPYTTGDLIKIQLYLEADDGPFRYVAFGVEGDPGTDMWFAPLLELIRAPGVDHYMDRLTDRRRISAGLGNFDFTSPDTVLEVSGGRLHLGELQLTVTARPPGVTELAARVGACACSQSGAPTVAVLDFGPERKETLEGDEVRLKVGDRNFIRGDTVADGRLNIADVCLWVSAVFLSPPLMYCPDAFDANDDSSINLTDAIYIIQYVFLGGTPPPQPFPAAGPDPTHDDLPCRAAP